MHTEAAKNYLSNAKKTLILEGNATGQLRDIIREKTGVFIENTYLKYDARPFYFQQIYQRVVEELKQ
jgi:2-oxoglutarate ferredoxin oxidoreductase subunit alpha